MTTNHLFQTFRKQIRVNWAGRLAWWLAALGLLLLTGANLLFEQLHPDTGWVFYIVNRLLDGAVLYEDLLDTNPPLVYYLTLPSVWLARVLGWPTIASFYGYIFSLLALSMGLCYWILKKSCAEFPALLRGTLLLVLLFLFTIEIRLFFGKHEHVMVMLVMPYLFAAIARANQKPLNWKLGFLVGILAGIGLMTKPFYLLPWLMIEGYLFFIGKQRHSWGASSISGKHRGEVGGIPHSWRSAENMGIIIMTLFYGLYLVWDGRFLSYVSILVEIYSPMKKPLIFVLLRHSYIILAALIAVQVTKPQTTTDSAMRAVLLIATFGFFAIGLYQQKNWHNHFYPAKVTAVLLVAFVMLRAAANRSLAWLQRVAIALTLWLFLQAIPPVLTGVNRILTALETNPVYSGVPISQLGLFKKIELFHTLSFKPDFAELYKLIKQHTDEGDYILQLGSTPYPAFSLVNYTHTRWSLPFTDLWFLTGLYRGWGPYRTIAEMDETERYLMDAAVSDMVAHPPKLIFVLDRQNFDYIAYFSQDNRFAELWSHYEPLTQLTVFHINGHQMQIFKYNSEGVIIETE